MIDLEMITLPVAAVAGAMLLFLTFLIGNQKGKQLIALSVVPVGGHTPTADRQLTVFVLTDEVTNGSAPQHFLVIEDDSVRQPRIIPDKL